MGRNRPLAPTRRSSLRPLVVLGALAGAARAQDCLDDDTCGRPSLEALEGDLGRDDWMSALQYRTRRSAHETGDNSTLGVPEGGIDITETLAAGVTFVHFGTRFKATLEKCRPPNLVSVRACTQNQIQVGNTCYDIFQELQVTKISAGDSPMIRNLPVVVSAPHDGTIEVPTWDVRSGCEGSRGCVTGRDWFSSEIAKWVAWQMFRERRRWPHLIVACLSRKMVDFNRDQANAVGSTSNNKAKRRVAWNRYVDSELRLKQKVEDECDRGFWLDFHGYGTYHGRERGNIPAYAQIGYSISQSNLKTEGDEFVKKDQDIQVNSSLRRLADMVPRCTLVRGRASLGTRVSATFKGRRDARRRRRYGFSFANALPSDQTSVNALKTEDYPQNRYLAALVDGYTTITMGEARDQLPGARRRRFTGMSAAQIELATYPRCGTPPDYQCCFYCDAAKDHYKRWQYFSFWFERAFHKFMQRNYGGSWETTCAMPAAREAAKNFIEDRARRCAAR